MDIVSLLIFLAIGAVSGWLAGNIMRRGGFGLAGNIVVGVVGAFVGGFAFDSLGMSAGSGILGSIVTAVIGAIILLFAISLLKKV